MEDDGQGCGKGVMEEKITGEAPDQDLNILQKDYWEWRLREFPELSTWTGDNRYNDRFTDLSPEAIERRYAEERRMLERARSIDRSGLAGQNLLSHELLLWDLSVAVDGQRFPPVLILSQIFGPHLMLPQLVSVTQFRRPEDYENYLVRLSRFPRYLGEVTNLLRRGIELGWVQPQAALTGVPSQISGQILNDVEESPLFAPFRKAPPGMAEDEVKRYGAEAVNIIKDDVFRSMEQFRDFVVNTYLPAGDRPVGVSSLPDGDAYYAHCIREFTTTELDSATIHQMGLSEVARIGGEIERSIEETGFRGSLDEFADFLRTDSRFYFTRAEDLVVAYRDIAKRADAELPALFAELPRTPYGVRPFPDYEAPSQTTAMYYPGASDGSRAGYFMVNTYRLDMRPKYEMEALTLHEAVPGHHLQIARAQELQDLPDFRRNGSYTAYVEGWALYAESLGSLMGFYEDPYSRFGRLMYEMWRACRLVVDTGIHAFGWTRKRAIEYMRENTAKTEQDIAIEVDRYIALPGQALAYKIGELAIKELRAKAERTLGAAFDIRRFHNAVLDNGPLPLPVLTAQIEDWISMNAKVEGR